MNFRTIKLRRRGDEVKRIYEYYMHLLIKDLQKI
jgi:hypothetical protein